MAGFGLSALGLSPFGIGTPVTATDPPDPADTQLSRYINPGSGDYEVDPITGHLKQMPTVRQRILLALKTTFGSSDAIPGLGVKKPKKIGSNFVDIMRRRVREALVQLTDVEKVARIDAILVSRLTAGRVGVVVAFTDLTQPNPADTSLVELIL